jgi:hypothetical protein
VRFLRPQAKALISEVAQLRLNDHWEPLSECETIAGDKPGAGALSGLARAFFYAGARAPSIPHQGNRANRGLQQRLPFLVRKGR